MTTDSTESTFELVLTRTVDVPRNAVWQAWTDPEQVVAWFAPKPWTTVNCQIDLRPGGIFSTTMRSPDGQDHGGDGCILEVVENERFAWTDALLPGYRPAEQAFFTAIIELADDGTGTRYTARALHRNGADRKSHEEMGFHAGWGQCLDQLVEHVKSRR
jgi:uncharacterized protein YndB with AHSA1/START domain